MTRATALAVTREPAPGRDRRAVLSLGLAGAVSGAAGFCRPAGASTADSVLSTYRAFVTAQNAGDLPAVRALFTDVPRFLWVSDGQSIWGRDAAIARMTLFRASEVWRVTPDLDRATAVTLDECSAYLHLPLDLEIGARNAPDRLPFLVSMLCHRATGSGPWAIAALFTTTRKPA
jgi:hypothetical protein